MGTRIEAAVTARRRGHVLGRGALHLTDAAARACLRRAHHQPSELDLLINAGIYKDHNAAEPALAAIIQEDIGANPGSPPQIGHHGTFSFDIQNGGCGVLTAAQLVDAFVGRGHAHLGMVVAGDADPSPRTSVGFPFSPAAGALLLGRGGCDTGFRAFTSRTFPEHAALFEATLRWHPGAGIAHLGRNVVEVREAPELVAACVEHAVEVAGELLAQCGLRASEIDLVIGSQYPRGFADQVARRLAIPDGRVPDVQSGLESAHTAGPIAALEAAIESGLFAHATHTLFVTAGAGITIAAALYTQRIRA
jgi:3-oxoacyl-[acyl-carrier-protein] synthase-3